MSCWEEAGVSFVVLCKFITATPRNLKNPLGRPMFKIFFFRLRPHFACGHPRGQGSSSQQVKIKIFNLLSNGEKKNSSMPCRPEPDHVMERWKHSEPDHVRTWSCG
jgi:hypothetical protein